MQDPIRRKPYWLATRLSRPPTLSPLQRVSALLIGFFFPPLCVSFIPYLLHIIIQNTFCVFSIFSGPTSLHLTLSNTQEHTLAVNLENVEHEANDLNNDERTLNFSFALAVDNGGKADLHLFSYTRDSDSNKKLKLSRGMSQPCCIYIYHYHPRVRNISNHFTELTISNMLVILR